MKKHKYVESWNVSLLPNGVYMVVFNLTELGLTHHRYNSENYCFGEDDYKYEDIKIPKFLPELKTGGYLVSSAMEKDQCMFYYAPYDFDTIKDRKIILNSQQ